LIVADASVLVNALVHPTPPLTARLAGEPALHAPQLLSLEVASALRGLVMAGKLGGEGAQGALEKLRRLPVVLHPHPPLLPRIWALRSNLTVYDAAYVALAELLGLPLLTADGKVARAGGLQCLIELV